MLLLVKKDVLSKYRALVLKMHQDVGTNIQAIHNLEFLCDLKVMICLSYIVPMLEQLNDLIKFS
jgi:hypothetical protein